MNYQEAVSRIWLPSGGRLPDEDSVLLELVRCATLAPSGHNTQCWRFRIDGRSITVSPDLSRRTPLVDPDDHHLYASLGCAIENLIQAAHAFGFEPETEFEPASGATTVKLTPAVANEFPLFRAIAGRQCTRIEFDGKPLTRDELDLLAVAGTGRGVHVVLLTERSEMEKALDFVVQGNTMQVENPAFVRELESWIRFSDEEAIRCGDGLSARVTGNPSAPRWLGKALFRAFFRAKPENDKYARQIRSSAGIAVFVSAVDDVAHWIEAGRCYERFALQATALGIRNAFVNQPVEEARLRPEFARAFGLGEGRPDLVVRFGRGKEMPKSLRRPVQAVLA
mgnify:CR=1 FL=1